MAKQTVHQVGLDKSAYMLLMATKLEMVEEGRASPTFSDAIRYLHEKAKECKKEVEQ